MELRDRLDSRYKGWELQGYAESLLTPQEIRKMYKKLERIPHKITHVIKRDSIKEAFKYNTWTYFVISTNGKAYVLDY